MTTQTDQILNHLSTGRTLTALEALKLYKCMRLAARIRNLRDYGIPIRSEMVRSKGKKYARYWME